jgi:hypothetical protein
MATAAAVVGVASTIGGIAAASKKGRGPRSGAYNVDKTAFAQKLSGAGPQEAMKQKQLGFLQQLEKGKPQEEAFMRSRRAAVAATRSGRGSRGARLRALQRSGEQGARDLMASKANLAGQLAGAYGGVRGQDIGLQKADKAALMNYERLRSGAAMQQDRAAMAADAADRKRTMSAWGAGAQGLGAIASMGAGKGSKDGGRISGPGTERSDSIPAMLSDGEFVVNAKTVRGLGKAKGGKNKAEDRALGMKFLYEVQEKFGKNPPFAGKNQSLNEERKIHEKNLKEDQEDDDKEFDEGQKKLNKKVKKDKKFLNKYIEVKKYNNGAQAGEGESYGEWWERQGGAENKKRFMKVKEREKDPDYKTIMDAEKKGKALEKAEIEQEQQEKSSAKDLGITHQQYKKEMAAEKKAGVEAKGRRETKSLMAKPKKKKSGQKAFGKALSGVGKKLSEGADQDTYSRDLLAQRNPEIFRRDITSKSLDLKDGGGAKEEFIAALGPHVDKIIESYEFGRGFGEVLAAKNKRKSKKRK